MSKDKNSKKTVDLSNVEPKGQIFVTPMEEVLPTSMLPYAECVIMDRAIPRVEDGLKPVQRRILYTMYDMGLLPDKPHKKCARIVGDCMGKYHPHGDSSVYDALVRLAQNFNMGRTLVNGHGNFGSIDGDSAAAMRYTEARLEPLALEILRDLDKDTVNWNLNFDDSLKEPATLPGRFPNLLVNGTSGIAVGLATNIPPHNLAEVIDGVIAYINNPSIKLFEMMKYIKGPDFPTGGYIIVNELVQAYETGRGRITMRAKVNVEDGEGNKKNIVISELPYQVNKANLLKKISDVKEDKKELFAGIVDIVDESDRSGMRAVIKVKKDADVDRILAGLYKYTDLECTFGINMVAIADGKPQQLGLLSIIKYYVAYQREVILRRTKFDLNNAKARCHLLEGLIIAVRNIDEVVAIIKKAEGVTDARMKLRERFNLSDKQAQAILDLRLARLTKLEVFKLEQELKELQALIKELTSIVENKSKQMEVVQNELREIKKAYKNERKSEIVLEANDIKVEKFDDVKPTTSSVLGFTASGKIKLMTEKNFNLSDKHISSTSSENEILTATIKITNDKTVLCFTDKGNCYRLNLNDLEFNKFKEAGHKFYHSCEAQKDEKVIAFYEQPDEKTKGSLLFYTSQGFVKKSDWSEYTVKKSVFQAVKLKENDFVIGIEETIEDENETIFFVTNQGMCLNAKMDDIPLQGRVSSGVRGIALNDKDFVISATQIDGEGEIIVATSSNGIKRIISSQIDAMVRYRKGVKIADLAKNERVVFADYVTIPYYIANFSDKGEPSEFLTEEIAIDARTAKCKPIKKRKDIKINKLYALKYLKEE